MSGSGDCYRLAQVRFEAHVLDPVAFDRTACGISIQGQPGAGLLLWFTEKLAAEYQRNVRRHRHHKAVLALDVVVSSEHIYGAAGEGADAIGFAKGRNSRRYQR